MSGILGLKEPNKSEFLWSIRDPLLIGTKARQSGCATARS